MTREEPYFKKCCFVIPLSLCLQTWAIIKLVAALTALGATFISFVAILVMGAASANSGALEITIVILLALVLATLCVDVSFNILLMVAICKKSTKLLRVFFIYDIYVIVTETIVFIVFIGFFVVQTYSHFWIFFIIFGILYILLDVWTLLAIKSEMIKLRNKEQYDFVKITEYPSEAEDIGLRQTLSSNLESNLEA